MPESQQRKRWFERNEQAERFEDEGRIQEALALYEQNAREDCDVVYTYERMSALYSRLQRFTDAADALHKAYILERKRGPSNRLVQLERRLKIAEEVRERNEEAALEQHRADRAASTLQSAQGSAKPTGCMGVVALFLVGAGSLLAAAAALGT